MVSYNHIALLGIVENLTNKILPSGTSVTEFILVADDSYINKAGEKVAKRVEITVSLMGAFAARLDKPLENGIRIIVEGSLQSNSKEINGSKKVWNSLLGKTVTFLDDCQKTTSININNKKSDSSKTITFQNELPF